VRWYEAHGYVGQTRAEKPAERVERAA